MIWDKKDAESDVAFEAFAVYRDLGASRSIAMAAKKLEKSHQLLERWSAENQWVLRANSWDAYLDKEQQRQTVKERKEMGRRHARIAMQAQAKLIERLNSIRPEQLQASDIPRWLEAAVKVERLARGADKYNSDTAAQEAAEELNLRNLSSKDLQQLDDLLRTANESAGAGSDTA